MAGMEQHQASPPQGAAPDWTIDQAYADYSEADHAVWSKLFHRQLAMLEHRACPEFFAGLRALELRPDAIPEFSEVNRRLEALTGWRVIAVPGLVPDAVFFKHLSERRFCAGRFIRSPEQLDYLEAPDVFHDVFGHVPMLCDPVFADYMVEYGKGGLKAEGRGLLDRLARLYWYTVEFGLTQTPEGVRIFGAGIVSSTAESRFALESPSPHRVGFELERVMRTPYRIDDFQQIYFVIPSLAELRRITLQDFSGLYDRLAQCDDIPIVKLLDGDLVFNRGDSSYGSLPKA